MEAPALQQSKLWGHMTDMLASAIKAGATPDADLVQQLSNQLLVGRSVPPPSKTALADGRALRSYIKVTGQRGDGAADDLSWVSSFRASVDPPKPPPKYNEDGEVEEDEADDDGDDKAAVEDIMEVLDLFGGGGVGVPSHEAYRLSVSLKRLSDKEPLASVRFWGKLTGVKADYLVAEAVVDPDRVAEDEAEAGDAAGDNEEDEDDEDRAARGEAVFAPLNTYKQRKPVAIPTEEAGAPGANKHTYYVAVSTDLAVWHKLPHAMPDHMVISRSIRHLLTGDLDAPVKTHPPFPGQERHYLRCLVARITHGSRVIPKDIQTLNEAPPDEEEDGAKKTVAVPPYEELPVPDLTEAPAEDDEEGIELVKNWYHGYPDDCLLQAANWVHAEYPLLHTQGRCVLWRPEDDPDEDEGEDGEAEKKPAEMIHPLLTPVTHDAKLPMPHHTRGRLTPWSVRKCFYSAGATSNVYLIASLRWPGAYTLAITEPGQPGAKTLHVYIGDGVKSKGASTSNHTPIVPQYNPEADQSGPGRDAPLMLESAPADVRHFSKPPLPPKADGDEEEEEEEPEEED